MPQEVVDNDKAAITAQKLKELQACLQSNESMSRSLFGVIICSSMALMSLNFATVKLPSFIKFPYVTLATLSGLFLGRYFSIKNCTMKVNHLNYEILPQYWELKHENMKDTLENQELAKTKVLQRSAEESIPDTESLSQTSLLDEFPAIYENIDVPNNKEPEKTVTYKELRERNREAYKLKTNVQQSIVAHDQRKEQLVQIKEYGTESKESDLFSDQSLGKHKTRYGDVWD